MTSHDYLNSCVIDRVEGCFIDFEGRADQFPAMIGVLISRQDHLQFQQHIIDPRLKVLEPSGHRAGEYPRFTPIDSVIDRLPKDLPIYAWSEHEQQLLNKHIKTTDSKEIPSVVNALRMARRWRSRLHPEWHPPVGFHGRPAHTQAAYMAKIRFAVPEKYGALVTGENLKRIDQAIAAGRDLRTMTKGQRLAWKTVLLHNRFDCYGLLAITSRVIRDLESDQS